MQNTNLLAITPLPIGHPVHLSFEAGINYLKLLGITIITLNFRIHFWVWYVIGKITKNF